MKTTGPVRYWNRCNGREEEEKILGEKALRWVYGSATGKMALHLLIKRAVFSRFLGWMKNSRRSAKEIPSFIRDYGINVREVEKAPQEYACFNDFFTRRLKPGARPVCADPDLALPADARHRAWQDASTIDGVYVKGETFDLPALLGDAQLAERYARGGVLLSRLCPVDYHRFHFPVSGVAEAARRIPGALASVAPYSLRGRLAWLWCNKRELTRLRDTCVGDVLILAIGATGVGSIRQTYTPGARVSKGEEQGFFAFGGSTIMTFFEPGRVRFAADLLEQTARGIEVYARQGEKLGTSVNGEGRS